MKFRDLTFLFLVMFGCVSAAAASGTEFSISVAELSGTRNAHEFQLQDQYNKSYSVSFPREKHIVLVFGDRKGSSQIEGWVRPLYDRYKSNIDIFGVAELSAVPGIAKPVVRQIFKSQVKYSVMLDWSGKVSRAYGYQPGKATIVLIQNNGSISMKKIGAATTGGLNSIYTRIDNF